MRTVPTITLILIITSPATALSQIPPPVWSGFSIGAAGGIGFGNAHSDLSGRIGTFSGVGSIYAGYDFQLPNGLVLGLATGVSPFPGLFGTTSSPCPASLCPGLQATNQFHTQVSWFADVRLRVGYAVGRFLPYLTAGFGFGEGKSSVTTSILGVPVSEQSVNSNLRGAVFGGGLQYALTHHLSADATYLRVQASANRVPSGGVGSNALRVGLDYRF